MGVPDELQALDDDLAAGRLDAATYRRRRDELRAAPAERAAPSPDPFPPPFRWDGASAAAGEITRVVTTPVARPEPERTQVVHAAVSPPRWSGPEPTQVVRTGADPTQVVPGAALARTVTASASSAGAPPWAAGALQRRQGSDLFVRAGGPTPAVLVSTTLVVIVAALVVVLSLVLS